MTMRNKSLEAAKQRQRKAQAAAERVEEAENREATLVKLMNKIVQADPTEFEVRFPSDGEDQEIKFNDDPQGAGALQQCLLHILAAEKLYARIQLREAEMDLLTK